MHQRVDRPVKVKKGTVVIVMKIKLFENKNVGKEFPDRNNNFKTTRSFE